MNAKHLTVLGIGNPLRRDDGIGIRIIQAMRENDKYRGIDLIDGGASPDLFSLIDDNAGKVIIVDALKGRGIPGSIYRFEIKDENLPDYTAEALHGLGIVDSLLMMKKLDIRRPEVTVIGIEPFDTSHGLGLSPHMEALVPHIIKTVEDEIFSD